MTISPDPRLSDSQASRPLSAQRSQVEAMAGYGVPEGDIARVLDVPADYLREHFRKELDSGQIKANTKVAENLYRKATGEGREAVTAAIFWLKTRAGWKETAVHEVSGRDGAPIETAEHSLSDIASALLSIICRDPQEQPRRIDP